MFFKKKEPEVDESQVIFAPWSGYYYPATIVGGTDTHAQIMFLNGNKAAVLRNQIVELEEAFKTMLFAANWKNKGTYYGGFISNRQPLTMSYNDGAVEQVKLGQLRGTKPK